MDDVRQDDRPSLSVAPADGTPVSTPAGGQFSAGSYYQPIGEDADNNLPLTSPTIATITPTQSIQPTQPHQPDRNSEKLRLDIQTDGVQNAINQPATEVSSQVASSLGNNSPQSMGSASTGPPMSSGSSSNVSSQSTGHQQADIVEKMKQANVDKKGFPKILFVIFGLIVIVGVVVLVLFYVNNQKSSKSVKIETPTSNTASKTGATNKSQQLPAEVNPAAFVDAADKDRVITVTEKDEFNLYQQSHTPTATYVIAGDLNGVAISGNLFVSKDQTTQQIYVYLKTSGMFALDDHLVLWIFDESNKPISSQVVEIVDGEVGRIEYAAVVLPPQTQFSKMGISQENDPFVLSPTGKIIYAN